VVVSAGRWLRCCRSSTRSGYLRLPSDLESVRSTSSLPVPEAELVLVVALVDSLQALARE
jgi:hypothetical protein